MGNFISVECIFQKILTPSWRFIVGQANYVWKLEDSLEALSDAIEELEAARKDIQERVNVAEQQQLKIFDKVQLWLSKAENMIAMAKKLIEDDGPQETDNLCLGGYFSKNCPSTYKFGGKVTKMLQEIKDLLETSNFEEVAGPQPAPSVVPIDVVQSIGLESTIHEIWSCIVDKDVGIIGLYGKGGVGKTTLLTHINNKFVTRPEGFDFVIWVTVSKDYNVKEIQDDIAERIGLKGFRKKKKKSDEKKRDDIYEALRNKKIVVLLDDVWERVDLEKIGIPQPIPPQTSHEIEMCQPSHKIGSQVIFTTRSSDVCSKMEAEKIIIVESLKPEEAWKLFRSKVGDRTLDSHPDIRELAQQVAKECDGLPLALITVGRSMASKTTPEGWEYAIEQLKQSDLPDMKDKVFPLLRFSYDNLLSEQKRCLLYCCLYPEDYNIPTKTLVEYWFCEGLLKGGRINDVQNQGMDIIESLVCACLLEKVEETMDRAESVKMHDVIRDMCLWIAREEKKFVVKTGEKIVEPDVEAWKGAKKVSLMQNQIEVLREPPTCPKLRTLFLSKNKLKEMSNGFFQSIPHLTVLNLSGNKDLQAVPKGISQLISLKCLDLSTTGITKLPIELKSLTELKMLDLRFMSIRKIPQHLISSFSKLQIFRMWHLPGGSYPKKDNVLDGGNNEKLLRELESLQHLNRLIIPPLKNMSALERFLSFPLFQRCTQALLLKDFREPIGFDVLRRGKMRRLDISGFEIMEEMKIEMPQTRIPRSTDDASCFLQVSKVQISGSQRSTDTTWLSLAPNLRYVKIIKCDKMEEVLNEGKLGEVAHVVGTPFPMLETLDLGFLPELKSIHRGVLPFPRLKNIKIRKCSKLKKLPLNVDSAKGNDIIIQGSPSWWAGLEWENEDTRHAFSLSFKSLKV